MLKRSGESDKAGGNQPSNVGRKVDAIAVPLGLARGTNP